MLPYLEEQGLYDQLDFDRWPDDPEHRAVIKTMVPVFQCPSTPGSPRLVMTYAHNARACSSGWPPKFAPDVPAGANDYDAVPFAAVSPPGSPTARLNVGAWLPGRSEYREIGYYSIEPRLQFRRSARLAEIVDGLSKTILIGERGGERDEFLDACVIYVRLGSWAWPSNTNLTAQWSYRSPPQFYVHSHVAMCDGSVRHLSSELDGNTLYALVTRAGREVVSED